MNFDQAAHEEMMCVDEENGEALSLYDMYTSTEKGIDIAPLSSTPLSLSTIVKRAAPMD